MPTNSPTCRRRQLGTVGLSKPALIHQYRLLKGLWPELPRADTIHILLVRSSIFTRPKTVTAERARQRGPCGFNGLIRMWVDRDDEAVGLPAAEADVQVNGGRSPGDVVDQEADHVFADALGGVWAGPACGETCGPREWIRFFSSSVRWLWRRRWRRRSLRARPAGPVARRSAQLRAPQR